MLHLWKKFRFRRDEEGATAVEFALVAPIFLVFVLGIMDLSGFYFVQGQLQNAVEQASRQIRVGEASIIGTGDTEKQNFRDLVCGHIHTVLINNCSTDLLVQVQSVDTSDGSGGDFGDLGDGRIDDTDMDGDIDWDDTNYDPGEGGHAVVATVYYVYNFLIPQMAVLTGGAVGDHDFVAISASTAFRNEPWGGSGP